MLRKIAIALITVTTAAGLMVADATSATRGRTTSIHAKRVVLAKRVKPMRSMRTRPVRVARVSTRINRRPVPLPRPAPNKNPAN
jgi:hypothetical protein